MTKKTAQEFVRQARGTPDERAQELNHVPITTVVLADVLAEAESVTESFDHAGMHVTRGFHGVIGLFTAIKTNDGVMLISESPLQSPLP